MFNKNYLIILLLNNTVFAEDLCSIPKRFAGHVTLNQKCIYEGDIELSQSSTILDCNGALISAQHNKNGIFINSHGKNIENITIKNCIINGAIESGIRTAWGIPDIKKANAQNRYVRTPHDITIDHVVISNTRKNGVFLDDYSNNITISNSKIKSSGGVAIYIEHNSIKNRIINNVLEGNGYLFKREAIAIDSSRENVIKNNSFIKNHSGGIFLYKNCSEHFSSGTQELRLMHSDYNIIKNNDFKNEKIGVWLASRQSRNLKKMECGDTSIDSKNMYYLDFANNNHIENNTFTDTLKPVINEGMYNIIVNNKYYPASIVFYTQPESISYKLSNLIPQGNTVQNNTNN